MPRMRDALRSAARPSPGPMIDAAVIGLGRWGKSIVEAVQGKSGRLRIIRGVSKEPGLVADFDKSHGFALGTDFSEAIADPRMQAVFLATPHSLHVEQIGAVAAAGKPVWCEKPLALTRAEAERAIAAVTKAEVVFGLGNNKRCFAAMRELKRVVASGTTGAGLHLIDAFVNLAGSIATVDAKVFSRKPPPDPRDVAAVLLQFESGATGLLATVRAAPMYWRVHVFGTKGSAEARDETTLVLARIGEAPQTLTFPQVDSL